MTQQDVPTTGPDARDRGLAVAGILGVAGYVGTWFVLGIVRSGYVPTQQAISELFDLGAPMSHRIALSVALAVTGALLVPFGLMLDRQLPGRGRGGPLLLAFSGAMTAAVVPFPCTSGCPGMGTTFTDTMHVVTAGSGYVALVTAPIAVGLRLRGEDRVASRVSVTMGTIALVGFIARNAGFENFGGLQQRVFNTTADLWIAVVGWWIFSGRWSRHGTDGSTSPSDGSLEGDRRGAGARLP